MGAYSLGDSGSKVEGLLQLVLLVVLSQGDASAISPTSAGWLLGISLLDTVSVMVRRIASGRPSFVGGRDYFHHVLQDLGLSRHKTLCFLMPAQRLFVAIGGFANQTSVPQYVPFWLFVAATVAQYCA